MIIKAIIFINLAFINFIKQVMDYFIELLIFSP